MSAREPGAPPRRRRVDVRLTIGLWVALLAASIPLLHVIEFGPWLPGAVVLSGVLLAVGLLARWGRMPAIAVSLAELLVWTIVLTAVVAPQTALVGLLPTPETVATVVEIVRVAGQEILYGVSPLPASPSITFLVVAATGLLTVALDHVVLTARLPLLAAVALVAVWLVPTIIVPHPVDIVAFVFLAAAVLYLLRAETRGRDGDRASRAGPGSMPRLAAGGISAMAASIGAVAIIVTVAAVPLLPQPTAQAAGGLTVPQAINPSLRLGEDLRRPGEVRVLTVRTEQARAPYLRVATLSRFDGETWMPDRGRSMDADGLVFGPVAVADGIEVVETETAITVDELISSWLPLSFPAVEADGLDGRWLAIPYNRTAIGMDSTTRDQEYTVTAAVPQPTVEQIRAAQATAIGLQEETFALPGETPASVFDLAGEVTAGADSDYDRLVALQSWFRGASFQYSLDAPVADGFDGSGAEAIAQFLEVRSGYCVHFASAFALMARALDMPSRIVVGYLPGEATGEKVDDLTVSEVLSSQLHAWPEVHFEGIGWVPFEPTKSLGVPTSFRSAASGAGADGAEDPLGPTPAPTSTAGPVDRADTDQAQGLGGGASVGVNLAPLGWTVLAVVVVALLPALVRTVRRRVLLGRARSGDAVAAWRAVQDAGLDVGLSVSVADSPRAFGQRLVALHGAPEDATLALVDAVERAVYAPPGAAASGDLAAWAERVRTGLLAELTARERLRVLLLPRSLVVRPGSAYAG